MLTTASPATSEIAVNHAADAVEYFAPAKINLALHVTGRRDDGYHLLDMLVVFARFGDAIRVSQASAESFAIAGRFAQGIPVDGSNLVIKARDALRLAIGRDLPPVSITLDKRLPIASGIGGGSSDAAATLLALNEFWQLGFSDAQLCEIGLPLGADVPMCLHGASSGAPLIARGVGEELTKLETLPPLPLLLVNDGTPLSTPDVFRALQKRDNPPLLPPVSIDIASLCSHLQQTRNDLLPAAQSIAPHLSRKLDYLREHQPLFAQMSGSGATCFAIFSDSTSAQSAAAAISAKHPEWFVVATETVGAV